jgi:hypothetical protein
MIWPIAVRFQVFGYRIQVACVLNNVFACRLPNVSASRICPVQCLTARGHKRLFSLMTFTYRDSPFVAWFPYE